LEAILFPLVLVAYTVGIVFAILGIVNRSRAARNGSLVAYSLACVLQLAGLLHVVATRGRLPLANLAEVLLTLGFLVVALYLAVQIRWKMDAAGLVLPPLAMIVTVIGLRLPMGQTPEPMLEKSGVLLFHVTLAALGMAAFFVAATMSLIYAIQDRALKSKRSLLRLERLPPLARLDRAGLEALVLGYPLFTLGIVTGIWLNSSQHQQLFVGGPKQIFPVLAWLVFSGVLGARLARGFRGRKAAYLTIVGFVLAVLSLMGISS
jgi:ABC-type uncharacterized transport system permease subunit